ncbi:hypothetical protein [Peribacillus loiseleuriae]|uniref:hypothetical protein n=1 Tax=Peribacillus loiseleuriae TaxID=1679170 RepID=UPI003D0152BC
MTTRRLDNFEAVGLNKDVLNISLVFPDSEKGIGINRGYDAMLDLIKHMLKSQQIEAREILGSYFPGSYHLSVNGNKCIISIIKEFMA